MLYFVSSSVCIGQFFTPADGPTLNLSFIQFWRKCSTATTTLHTAHVCTFMLVPQFEECSAATTLHQPTQFEECSAPIQTCTFMWSHIFKKCSAGVIILDCELLLVFWKLSWSISYFIANIYWFELLLWWAAASLHHYRMCKAACCPRTHSCWCSWATFCTANLKGCELYGLRAHTR
jgi:hypothetical protein